MVPITDKNDLSMWVKDLRDNHEQFKSKIIIYPEFTVTDLIPPKDTSDEPAMNSIHMCVAFCPFSRKVLAFFSDAEETLVLDAPAVRRLHGMKDKILSFLKLLTDDNKGIDVPDKFDVKKYGQEHYGVSCSWMPDDRDLFDFQVSKMTYIVVKNREAYFLHVCPDHQHKLEFFNIKTLMNILTFYVDYILFAINHWTNSAHFFKDNYFRPSGKAEEVMLE